MSARAPESPWKASISVPKVEAPSPSGPKENPPLVTDPVTLEKLRTSPEPEANEMTGGRLPPPGGVPEPEPKIFASPGITRVRAGQEDETAPDKAAAMRVFFRCISWWVVSVSRDL